MAFHYSPNVTTNGLVLYMDTINIYSYSGTGLTWSDISGVNIGGTLSSVTYNSTTKSFDTNVTLGTQSNNISCGTITFVDASEYTLDFWVKLRTGVGSTQNSIFGSYVAFPVLFISSTSNSWTPRFFNSTNTDYTFNYITDYNLEQNWGNITLVFKSNRNIDFYLNSVYKQTITTANTSFIINKIASGFFQVQLGIPTYYPLQGSISATKIYNRALIAPEIEKNYLTLKSRFGHL